MPGPAERADDVHPASAVDTTRWLVPPCFAGAESVVPCRSRVAQQHSKRRWCPLTIWQSRLLNEPHPFAAARWGRCRWSPHFVFAEMVSSALHRPLPPLPASSTPASQSAPANPW